MTVQPQQAEVGSFSQVLLHLKPRGTQERSHGVSAVKESPEVRPVTGDPSWRSSFRQETLPEAVKVKSGLGWRVEDAKL